MDSFGSEHFKLEIPFTLTKDGMRTEWQHLYTAMEKVIQERLVKQGLSLGRQLLTRRVFSSTMGPKFGDIILATYTVYPESRTEAHKYHLWRLEKSLHPEKNL